MITTTSSATGTRPSRVRGRGAGTGRGRSTEEAEDGNSATTSAALRIGVLGQIIGGMAMVEEAVEVAGIACNSRQAMVSSAQPCLIH